MKILPVAAELFPADGQTDGQAEATKLTVAREYIKKEEVYDKNI